MDIERDTAATELPEWIAKFDKQLTEHGFKPVALVAPAAAPAGGQNVGAAEADDDEWLPKFCPDCGAAKDTFYDNRTDPNRPQGGPDLKCRKCTKGFWKTPPRGGQARRRS